jgi:adenosine deaminase
MPDLLLTTLGITWQIVPELYAFTNPQAANELHRAARLSPQGLSLWEVCSLVRNGFRSAFAPREVRTSLLRQAEEEVIDLIQQGIWP